MDHGGDLDRAIALYGGQAATWIDLSTGINRMPYPIPPLSQRAWTALPTREDMATLCAAALRYYGAKTAITALAGAQNAIQLLPSLRPIGLMRIIGPTYNEYAKVFTQAGWRVEGVEQLAALNGADIAIVVNPNNPDGRLYSPHDLRACAKGVGILVVDESFMDIEPSHSLAADCELSNILILKSFGKFFGLAGLRLGFVLGALDLCMRLRDAVGPWPVSGAGVAIATQAFADQTWIVQSRITLSQLAMDLDLSAPWQLVGGTGLFRLYETGDAQKCQATLAKHHIWTRKFPWSDTLLRLGTPAPDDFTQLKKAFAALNV